MLRYVSIEFSRDGAIGIEKLTCLDFQLKHVDEIQTALVEHENGPYFMLINIGDTAIEIHITCKKIEEVLHR